MAKSHPDFFGQSIFPKFGSFLEHQRQVTSIANTLQAGVFSLSLKALIYGGYLTLSSVDAVDGVDVLLAIDGVEILSRTLEDLFLLQWSTPGGYPFSFSLYDVVAKKFTLVGPVGVTIESSLVLTIDNDTGSTIYVDGAIHYANVV